MKLFQPIRESIRFDLIGKPAIATNIDGAWISPRDCTIIRVAVYRRIAGISGSMIIDVNLNGTTIYTTQGNRPTITAAGGGDQTVISADPDVISIVQDDRIQWDVDQLEVGNPLDVTLVIEVSY